jgi:hypothetical protein
MQSGNFTYYHYNGVNPLGALALLALFVQAVINVKEGKGVLNVLRISYPTDGASTWSWWWGLYVPMTQRAMPAVA